MVEEKNSLDAPDWVKLLRDEFKKDMQKQKKKFQKKINELEKIIKESKPEEEVKDVKELK